MSGGWQPIETAPDMDRVWVCGYQPRRGSCAGYWWYHEDVTADGKPFDHPDASHWCAIVLPKFPPAPEHR